MQFFQISTSRYTGFRILGERVTKQVLYILGLGTLFLLFAGTAFGQKDSLITNDGQVLVGRYNKPVFGHSSFTIKGKKIPLDAAHYKAYKNDDKWYRSVQVSASVDPVWMECLELGSICLFQYVTYGSATRISPRNLPASYVVWLASKNSGPLLNVNGVMASEIQAKENLHKLLLDQPGLAGELENAPFTTGVVRGLIAAYNRKVNTTK